MTSFIQILDKFEEFATSNVYVNRYGVGPAEEINMKVPNDGKYPFMWIIPQNVTVLDNAVTYKFRFLIFDKDDTDDRLRIQKQNDTLATMIDLKTFLLENGDYENQFEVSTIINIFPFQQEFVDYTVGWFAELEITTDAQNNPCRTV